MTNVQVTSSITVSEIPEINPSEIVYQPSYEDLFRYETDPHLPESERGTLTTLGAVSVDTGKFTGRSAKDKYFVEEALTRDNLWWGEVNQKISSSTFDELLMMYPS